MPLPPTVIPAKRRVHRKRRVVASAAPAAAPVLVAATFDTTDGGVLTLTFDRDVAIGTFVTSAVLVVNEPGETRFDGGGGAFLDAPNLVRVDMIVVDVIPAGPNVLLSATGATGIVAVDGGAAWAGVTELSLPFT